jgi:hypothetical protein
VLTIPDACQLLELSEAQFHHLRHAWLQDSLELLEPRRVGRPPKQENAAELTRQCAQLEAEVQQLRAQVHGAQLREEIARILADPQVPSDPASGAGKKTADEPNAVKPR